MSTKHKLGKTVLSYLPSGRELYDFMEGLYARQYAKAKTSQERREIGDWIRASRMNGNNERGNGRPG